MTNEELDNYMKTVNLNFDSHIEKGTIEMSNEYYNLLEEKMARLINENQELKKQLEDMTDCRDIASGHRKEVQDRETILLNQQKEFIKWLESIKFIGIIPIEMVCDKYKEITGVLDDNKTTL